MRTWKESGVFMFLFVMTVVVIIGVFCYRIGVDSQAGVTFSDCKQDELLVPSSYNDIIEKHTYSCVNASEYIEHYVGH